VGRALCLGTPFHGNLYVFDSGAGRAHYARMAVQLRAPTCSVRQKDIKVVAPLGQ
jgi:hypothetical protein